VSDLSRRGETAAWIDAWRRDRHGKPGGAERLAKVFRRTADEQRANWRGAEGRWRTDRHSEYGECVDMLESAAAEAELT
jgi:hypothetical protein